MAQPNHTPRLAHTEEALTVLLFCLVDDAYTLLNPHDARRYQSIKRLSDSGGHHPGTLPATEGRGVGALVFARHQEILLSAVPRSSGAAPFLFPSAGEEAQTLLGASAPRNVLSEMIGNPETLLVDSTLLSVLHPRQISQGSGFPGSTWVRWGSFSV